MTKIQLNYTGSIQNFTIPAGVTRISIKVWGAGGGGQATTGSNSVPGAGGYSYGELFVTPGQVLQATVGQGGQYRNSTTSAFGGGGIGGNGGFAGSGGGGRSGVALLGQNQFIIAGGGGGAGVGNISANIYFGGNGGGTTGNNAVLTNLTPPASVAATGGSQSAGGTGGSYSGTVASNAGLAGTSLQGGKGGTEASTNNGGGGGGGGGYFGGGGGAGTNETAVLSQQEQPGGGGSGFINTAILLNALTQASPQNTTKTNALPPNTTDPDYVTGIGVGYTTITLAAGGNGLVVINYSTQTLTKSVDKTSAAVGDTLNYTVVFVGDGSQYYNAVFYDTIPTGTTFVPNSLIINSVPSTGNPNLPGVNLGTIGPGNTTITFSVKVTSLPSPNTIVNTANIYATSVPNIASNSVTTSVFQANLSSSKIVNKINAAIGDILTYTIPITNTGNTTATNILFIDTIPNGTTLISGTFNQDGTAIGTSPNPPGVYIPNSIGIGKTSTITFKVRIDSAPSPNPIPNTASSAYSYFISGTTIVNATNTNIVNTNVNYASLSGITKYVDKNYATCGEVINYQIIIPNTGNVTAQNVIFKDTIPNGTIFVTNSVFINGTNQPGFNPSVGITVPNIAPGAAATVTFSVQVVC